MSEPASTHKIVVKEGTILCGVCGEPASWMFTDPATGNVVKRSSPFVKIDGMYIHSMCAKEFVRGDYNGKE